MQVCTFKDFCNRIELIIEHNVRPEHALGEDFFFECDWDSDTRWIKLGIPQEWFLNEDEDEE